MSTERRTYDEDGRPALVRPRSRRRAKATVKPIILAWLGQCLAGLFGSGLAPLPARLQPFTVVYFPFINYLLYCLFTNRIVYINPADSCGVRLCVLGIGSDIANRMDMDTYCTSRSSLATLSVPSRTNRAQRRSTRLRSPRGAPNLHVHWA